MGAVAGMWLYAVMVGLTAAGFTGSLWRLAAGERPNSAMLGVRNLALPAAIFAFVVHWPIRIIELGCLRFAQGRLSGLAIIGLGVVWCFFQGVFILTEFFGVT